MLTSGRTGRAGTCGQSQFIPGLTPDVWKGDPTQCGWDKFSPFRLYVQCLLRLCMYSTECGSGKGLFVLATYLLLWASRGCSDLKACKLHLFKVDTLDTQGHLPWKLEEKGPGAVSRWWLWPQWWAGAAAQPLLWARGLQRIHVWATGPGSGSGWSAEELQGSRWGRTGWTRKTKMSGPWVTPLSETTNIRKGHHISMTLPQWPKTQNPIPSCQFQNRTKEKSHCSPSREAHP